MFTVIFCCSTHTEKQPNINFPSFLWTTSFFFARSIHSFSARSLLLHIKFNCRPNFTFASSPFFTSSFRRFSLLLFFFFFFFSFLWLFSYLCIPFLLRSLYVCVSWVRSSHWLSANNSSPFVSDTHTQTKSEQKKGRSYICVVACCCSPLCSFVRFLFS